MSSRRLMSIVKNANSDEELDTMIKGLGADRCTVVYFYLPWCGSCQKMNPVVDALAEKNTKTLFIKVDAERCVQSTKRHKIMKVPSFVLYNNRTKVDRVEGASPIELETKVKRIQNDLDYKKSGGFGPVELLPQGVKMSDVSAYMDKKNSKCVNDLVPTAFQGFLEGKKLVSGKGVGRLLLMYSFTEKMVIQSLRIKAPTHSGPKVLRLFINIPKPLELGLVHQMTPTQEIILNESDLTGDHGVDLKQGGFIGINSLQIYIPENMTKSRRIEIDSLILNGAPFALTPYASREQDYYVASSGNKPGPSNRISEKPKTVIKRI